MEALTSHIPIQFRINRSVRKYTLEEYLRKEAKSEEKYEYINGQIIKMPYAKGPHNIISGNMIAEMKIALKQLPKKYIVFPSDQKVYFPSLNEGVYADTLAVCEKPIYWDESELLLINPIIVVEVLSKSSGTPPAQRYDRTSKFDKYKTLESIREYVLIRQDECYAEVWFRERPGFWQESIIKDINAVLPLQSVGVSIPLLNIYENIEFK
jgi:Uma2 family endonuclease